MKYDQQLAAKFLRELCIVAKEEWLDYDSARQILWAVKATYQAMTSKPKKAVEIEALLVQIEKLLKVDQFKNDGNWLAQRMKINSEYDQKEFKQRLEELSSLLHLVN